MFICQYCGTSYAEFKSPCARCGASLDRQEKASSHKIGSLDEKIRQICTPYEDAREFLPKDALSAKKLRAAEKNFTLFPQDKEIILLCDTHPLRKGKRGFIICNDGIYWQNTWAAKTNRNYLAWDEFAKRELKLKHYHLHLGRGDVIGLSGLGSDVKREKAERLLKEINDVLNG